MVNAVTARKEHGNKSGEPSDLISTSRTGKDERNSKQAESESDINALRTRAHIKPFDENEVADEQKKDGDQS